MIEMWLNDKLEAAAGVRQQLEAYARDHADVRITSGAFQQIQQATGHAEERGRAKAAGAAYLKAFVEEMKASGFVADGLKRSNQVAALPPANSSRLSMKRISQVEGYIFPKRNTYADSGSPPLLQECRTGSAVGEMGRKTGLGQAGGSVSRPAVWRSC